MRHPTICPLCEALCGLEITVEEGTITEIRGDQADPLSRGHICPKAIALQDLHTDPDRLRAPQIRTKAGFRAASWGEALDYAAEGLKRVQSDHGNDAVAVYLGNPNVHNVGNLLLHALPSSLWPVVFLLVYRSPPWVPLLRGV